MVLTHSGKVLRVEFASPTGIKVGTVTSVKDSVYTVSLENGTSATFDKSRMIESNEGHSKMCMCRKFCY